MKTSTTSTTAKRSKSINAITRWASAISTKIGKHKLSVIDETISDQDELIDELSEIARNHYVTPKTTAKRLLEHGAPKTAELFREYLPTMKKARSGDLGEIVATEIAECHLRFKVPIRRLRWKDGRNMALRGDDIIGLNRDKTGKLIFLKGESKSRASLTTNVLEEAGAALDNNRGRPTRHSVLFVADRLRELGKDGLALKIEDAVLNGFQGMRVEHLIFVLTGNNPGKLLTSHLQANAKKMRLRHAIGLRIKDHGELIKKLFGGL